MYGIKPSTKNQHVLSLWLSQLLSSGLDAKPGLLTGFCVMWSGGIVGVSSFGAIRLTLKEPVE